MRAVTRCVLFDLFGTLVTYDSSRTAQNYSNSYQTVLAFGCQATYEEFQEAVTANFAKLDVWSEQHQREFSMHDFAKSLFVALALPPAPEKLDQFVEVYTQDWSAPVKPIPGVPQLLSRCGRDFKTGIITNTHYTPMVMRLLRAFDLDQVGVVTTSVEHGKPKPHADIFRDTLKQLEVLPTETIYVGDSYVADFQGATAAGLTCYLVGQHARVPREYQIPTVLDLPVHLFRAP